MLMKSNGVVLMSAVFCVLLFLKLVLLFVLFLNWQHGNNIENLLILPELFIEKVSNSKCMLSDFHALGFSLGQVLDKAKHGTNLLFSYITEYLIRKRRINDCLELVTPLSQEDPTFYATITEALIAIDKTKEGYFLLDKIYVAILIIAKKIKEYPYLVSFLHKQARAFIKCDHYENALKLAKICVELCPESFECWLLLADAYFRVKQINMVWNFCIIYFRL